MPPTEISCWRAESPTDVLATAMLATAISSWRLEISHSTSECWRQVANAMLASQARSRQRNVGEPGEESPTDVGDCMNRWFLIATRIASRAE